jgi:two-component system NarL family response regulator
VSGKEQAIRILIVDDHFVARFGLRGLLETQADMTVVAEAASGEQAIAEFATHAPGLVLMDSRMPGLDGPGATMAIRKACPTARILILSSFDTEADVQRALDAGANGYLMKEAEPAELLAAIRDVASGRSYMPGAVAATLSRGAEQSKLSSRDLKMLQLLAHGMSNVEIATEVGLTKGSVRIYLSLLFQKMAVNSRGEAVAVAVQRGLVRPKL